MTLIIVLIQAIQTAFFDYLKWQKIANTRSYG